MQTHLFSLVLVTNIQIRIFPSSIRVFVLLLRFLIVVLNFSRSLVFLIFTYALFSFLILILGFLPVVFTTISSLPYHQELAMFYLTFLSRPNFFIYLLD